MNKFNYKLGEHAFILGKTGSGKTYLVKYLIKKYLKTNFVIFNIKPTGYEGLGCHTVTTYEELVKALKAGKKKILFQNKYLTKELLDKCLKLLYLVVKGKFTVIVDELHFFTSKSQILEWMAQFLKVGREEEKGFWGISQRGQDIHNTILSQSTHKLCGYVSEEDREYMSTKLDLNKKNYTFLDLKQYEFFYLRDEAGYEPQIVKV